MENHQQRPYPPTPAPPFHPAHQHPSVQVARLEQEVEEHQLQAESRSLEHLGLGAGFDRAIANKKEGLDEVQARKKREEARKQLFHGFDAMEETTIVGDGEGVSPLRMWGRRVRLLVAHNIPLQRDLFAIEVGGE
jgi:hypothetical protein